MKLKLEILHTVLNLETVLKEADPAIGVDLGAYTVGWHDEWMWTPEYWSMRGNAPHVTSNCPEHGIGNNSYESEPQFWGHLASIQREMLLAGKPSEPDCTEGFAILTDRGLEIYEVRAVPLEEEKRAAALNDQNKLDKQILLGIANHWTDNEILKMVSGSTLGRIAKLRS